MKHILRLNVYSKGYTLFSGEMSRQFQEFPLDIVSNNITRNYLSAQKRLDSIMQIHISRWGLCVSNTNPNENPVVAYGCLLPLEDDKGRFGISFVHAIEADDPTSTADIVACITQSLSSQSIIETNKNLDGLAKGSIQPEQAINFSVSLFQKNYRRQPKFSISTLNPIKEIQHDCGGAWAIAWLAITVSHLGISSPWEIYDGYSPNSNSIATISSYKGAFVTYSLSEYLSQLVRDHELLKNLDTWRSRNLKEDTPRSDAENQPEYHEFTPQGYERNTEPVVKIGLRPPQKEYSIQGRKDSSDFQNNREQKTFYPPNSHIVKMDGLYGNELLLVEETHTYRIDSENYISLLDRQTYYEFLIIEYIWWGLNHKKVTLILPKDNLTDKQLNDLNRFYGLYSSNNPTLKR